MPRLAQEAITVLISSSTQSHKDCASHRYTPDHAALKDPMVYR